VSPAVNAFAPLRLLEFTDIEYMNSSSQGVGPMTFRKLPLIVLSAIAFAGLAGDQVQARTPYDGGWSVVIAGQRGACAGSSYRFAIQIINGIIRYGGSEAQFSGRVSPNGAVSVGVRAGDQVAVGGGRLSRNVGGGTWRGRSAQGACAGSWSAQRRGDF
jgi:hypothetical protein